MIPLLLTIVALGGGFAGIWCVWRQNRWDCRIDAQLRELDRQARLYVASIKACDASIARVHAIRDRALVAIETPTLSHHPPRTPKP